MPTPDSRRKPTDREIDVFGLTHPGKVRETNEDHFLICQLRKRIDVHSTSLPVGELEAAGSERLAFLAMVADGVGGRPGGESASRRTIQAITRYVSESVDAYYTADSTDHEAFTGALHAAVLRVHEELISAGEQEGNVEGMATTLTLFFSIWPTYYLLQLGDSRY